MISLFSTDLILSVVGLYLAGVVSGVSGLCLYVAIYVGRGKQIIVFT